MEGITTNVRTAGAPVGTLNRPKSKKEKALEQLLEDEVTQVEAKQYEDDDLICFVRLNWGLAGIPAGKIDYVDNYQFVGGLARNVEARHAKKWLKNRRVLGHIFDNDISMDELAREMGRNPGEVEADSLRHFVEGMSSEKILTILGPEQAEALARKILRESDYRG